MKRVCVVDVLKFFTIFEIKAQYVFSKYNLANASQIELNDYLSKAKKNRTAGIILTISGPILFAVDYLLIAYGPLDLFGDFASFLLLMSFATPLVGLAMLIINSVRIKRINELNKGFSEGVFLDMSPYSCQDKLTQSHSVGIKLRLRF